MNPDHVTVVLRGCDATGARRVLVTSDEMRDALVQRDSSISVTVADDDIWMMSTDVRCPVVVTSRDCPPHALYSRISSIAAVVEPPYGLVFLLPRDGDPLAGREAIEAFLGIYNGANENRATHSTVWIERKLDHDIVELRRTK